MYDISSCVLAPWETRIRIGPDESETVLQYV